MKEVSQVKLIHGTLKKFEKQFIEFYDEVGKIQSLNETTTKIFAYFQLYERLTQDQLKQLTNFSLSTISTTLQAFLQTEILLKEPVPNSRSYTYRLRKDKVTFIYLVFSHIMDYLEHVDEEVNKIQIALKKTQEKFPEESSFLIKRLNGIRNYIEAQRRAIKYKKKHDFFEEIPANFFNEDYNLQYSEELLEIEESIINLIVNSGLFYGTEPIKNQILAHFITQKRITQEKLESLTNFSRSTISRNLKLLLERGLLKAQERQYRQPVQYYLETISLEMIEGVLISDHYIFSWEPKFKEIIKELQSNDDYRQNKDEYNFLLRKFKTLLIEIEEFKVGSNKLEKAKQDLVHSLNKK